MLSLMQRVFDPRKDCFDVNTREEFEQLLMYAQNPRFSKSTICILRDIQLTDSDLQNLISLLKNNPRAVASFTGLTIDDNPLITELPDLSVFKINGLHFKSCGFTIAPDLRIYPHLDYLSITRCKIAVAPVLTHNKKLKFVCFCECPLTYAPDFSANTELKTLYLVDCGLTIAPEVAHCVKLMFYRFHNNKIKIPPSFKTNIHLQTIDFSNNDLEDMPEVEYCVKLKFLILSQNKIRRLKGKLPASLKDLDVSNNLLCEPPDVSSCSLLETLAVQHNSLLNPSDVSHTPRMHFLRFDGNPLTLTGKIYLMCYRPKKSIIDFPFDLPDGLFDLLRDPADNLRDPVYTDFMLLAKLFKKLPVDVRENLISQMDFVSYKDRYFACLSSLLQVTAPYQFWDVNLSLRVLEFCMVLQQQWQDHNIQLLQEAFANNARASFLVESYARINQEIDRHTQATIINPQIESVKELALTQFNRYKRRNNNPAHPPVVVTNIVPEIEDERFNRITASYCVIS